MATSRKRRGRVSIYRKAWGRVPRHATVMLFAASFALLGVLFLLSSCSSGQSAPSTSEAPTSANIMPQREFPSFVYNSAQVLQAYKTAVQIPEVLLLMPCYCGCGEAHDHKNLKDCFFKEDGSLNDHGAFCEICDMEAADIPKWQEEGYSLERIRELIDEKYRDWGEPTNTPPINHPGASPIAKFSGGPRLSFDKDSVDLGEVPLDIPINYAFRFKNVGNAPLNIVDTQSKALVGC